MGTGGAVVYARTVVARLAGYLEGPLYQGFSPALVLVRVAFGSILGALLQSRRSH